MPRRRRVARKLAARLGAPGPAAALASGPGQCIRWVEGEGPEMARPAGAGRSARCAGPASGPGQPGLAASAGQVLSAQKGGRPSGSGLEGLWPRRRGWHGQRKMGSLRSIAGRSRSACDLRNAPPLLNCPREPGAQEGGVAAVEAPLEPRCQLRCIALAALISLACDLSYLLHTNKLGPARLMGVSSRPSCGRDTLAPGPSRRARMGPRRARAGPNGKGWR